MCEWTGSRKKHPGTKHSIPLFATPDNTSTKDLLTRTKENILLLSLGQNIFMSGRNGMECFVREGKKWPGMFCQGWQKLHGMFCPGWQNLAGCFVMGVKNGMGCFVPGCFVLHSNGHSVRSLESICIFLLRDICPSFGTYCIGEQLVLESPTQSENRIKARVYARSIMSQYWPRQFRLVSSYGKVAPRVHTVPPEPSLLANTKYMYGGLD